MTMNSHEILFWLEDFKSKWLPENLSNDTILIESITTKLRELDQLLTRKY